MCGIAGIFTLNGVTAVDRETIRSMTRAIAHRGPDGEGFFFGAGVGLGHRRLAIIDVAGGQQPILNEDESVALVFNGQIYNYRALREELLAAGHIFRTQSDTEVIVHAWEEWGASCVKRLRGMFAFALYDGRRNVLFLARDRLGKKPLYYSVLTNGDLIFGSELKALLAHPLAEKRLDPFAVDNYLAFGYVPDPQTIYRGIHKLPPAHTLEVQRHAPTPNPQRYWRLSMIPANCDEREAVDELRHRLDEAVRIRLMSEVPLGAFLSGGVDSSGIVSSMARQTTAPVKTFALDFDEGGASELHHARRIAELYGTDHKEACVQMDPLETYLAQAAIFDEPFADSSSVPTFEVSRLARQRVTVALSGDAGDEIFAGYRRYRWHARTDRLRRALPEGLRRSAFRTLGAAYPKLDWAPQWLRAKTTLNEIAVNAAEGYFRSLCKIDDAARWRLYTPQMRQAIIGQHPCEIIAGAMREVDSDDPVTCAQYADLVTYLPGDILAKVDRASMAVSLEIRAPLLDHELVEWAGTLPSSLKLRGTEGKYILKRTLEPFVPGENLYRRKEGFTTSLASHFRGAGNRTLRSALTSDLMVDSGLFDLPAVDSILDAHESGMRDNSQILWTLLMFAGFLEKVHFAGTPEARVPRLTLGSSSDAHEGDKASQGSKKAAIRSTAPI
ncbi:MAG TPA: XrtA/PEP-CTERM system amidotransferase [Rhizomicrobium sp.]|nr:XrtA/PEP-CTERM system amidotransferase [Rhizomicrobium sp.]